MAKACGCLVLRCCRLRPNHLSPNQHAMDALSHLGAWGQKMNLYTLDLLYILLNPLMLVRQHAQLVTRLCQWPKLLCTLVSRLLAVVLVANDHTMGELVRIRCPSRPCSPNIPRS